MAAALKLGDVDLQLNVPADLDEKLQASVGCSAAEVCRMLEGRPVAGFVAAALLPMLDEQPPVKSDLARMIAAAGVNPVRKRLLSLYRAATRPKKPKKEEAGHAEEQPQT